MLEQIVDYHLCALIVAEHAETCAFHRLAAEPGSAGVKGLVLADAKGLLCTALYPSKRWMPVHARPCP